MVGKISEMTAAAALTGAEQVEVVQSGANLRTTTGDIAALTPEMYRGMFVSLAALNAAVPTASAGDYADVDSGSGSNVKRYIWDTSDAAWVEQAGSGAGMTNPMTTAGDMIYGGAAGVPTRLPVGATGNVLGVVAGAPAWVDSPTTQSIIIACSDESTALTAGSAKVTFRMPYGFTLSAIRGSLTTPQSSGSLLTVNVKESGTTILSTKLIFDNAEKTTTTAATPPVISDANLADDAEITVDIDQVGDGTAKGLKVYLIGVKV